MKKEQIRHIGFLLSHVGKFMHLRLNKILKEMGYDITLEQVSVLLALTHNEGINQQELSDITFRDKTSILRILDWLDKHNLVEREKDTKDRRNNLIYLTDKGRENVKRSGEIMGNILELMFANISSEDVDKFEEIVDKLFKNVKPENYNKPTYESVFDEIDNEQ